MTTHQGRCRIAHRKPQEYSTRPIERDAHHSNGDAHAGLTRHCNETVLIGSEIAVTVVAVNGSQVRLGIEAPKHIRVLREELVEQDAARRGVAPGGHARE